MTVRIRILLEIHDGNQFKVEPNVLNSLLKSHKYIPHQQVMFCKQIQLIQTCSRTVLSQECVKKWLQKLQSMGDVVVSDLEAWWSHGKPTGRWGRHRRAERFCGVRWRPPPREPGSCEPPPSALGVVPTGQQAPATQDPAEDKEEQINNRVEDVWAAGGGRKDGGVKKIHYLEKHSKLRRNGGRRWKRNKIRCRRRTCNSRCRNWRRCREEDWRRV